MKKILTLILLCASCVYAADFERPQSRKEFKRQHHRAQVKRENLREQFKRPVRPESFRKTLADSRAETVELARKYPRATLYNDFIAPFSNLGFSKSEMEHGLITEADFLHQLEQYIEKVNRK